MYQSHYAYPDIGQGDIGITVEYDSKKDMWPIDLYKDSHELKHNLELSEAKSVWKIGSAFRLGLRLLSSKKNHRAAVLVLAEIDIRRKINADSRQRSSFFGRDG